MQMERNTKGNIGGKEKFKRGKNKMRRKSIFENLIKLLSCFIANNLSFLSKFASLIADLIVCIE